MDMGEDVHRQEPELGIEPGMLELHHCGATLLPCLCLFLFQSPAHLFAWQILLSKVTFKSSR